jgi:hypothetical protein
MACFFQVSSRAPDNQKLQGDGIAEQSAFIRLTISYPGCRFVYPVDPKFLSLILTPLTIFSDTVGNILDSKTTAASATLL